MTDKQRTYQRNIKGQFAKVDVERDVLAGDLGIPQTYAYDLTPRHAPAGDVLAQGGESSPPGVRTARMTGVQRDAGSEIYATQRFGIQGRWGREAARRSTDPMDPSRHLTGAE